MEPIEEGDDCLVMPKGLAQIGKRKWEHTLVGYFVDRCIPIKVVTQRAHELWGKMGMTEVRDKGDGLFLFIF